MLSDPRYPWLSMPGDGNPVWSKLADCFTCDNTGEVEHKSGDTIIPLPCPDCPRGDAKTWRIAGVGRTHEEEMADEESDAMERSWER